MSIISVLVVLIIVGLLLFAVNNWLPMDAKIKTIINVVVVLFVCLWLINIFFPGLTGMKVSQLLASASQPIPA